MQVAQRKRAEPHARQGRRSTQFSRRSRKRCRTVSIPLLSPDSGSSNDVQKRKARMGVNPRNPSQKVHIPAARVPKFTAGSALKATVRGGSAAASSPRSSRGPPRTPPSSVRPRAMATVAVTHFADRLAAAVERKRSQLVVGLDPVELEQLPARAVRRRPASRSAAGSSTRSRRTRSP